jgi:hypothetical protein
VHVKVQRLLQLEFFVGRKQECHLKACGLTDRGALAPRHPDKVRAFKICLSKLDAFIVMNDSSKI